MMIPDFSSGDADINKKRSVLLEQLAKAKDAAQDLQSDETQSRLEDALKRRTDQHDAAALDSSKTDASHSSASTEVSHQKLDESLNNSTSTTEKSDASQQKAQEPAGEHSRKLKKLPEIAAPWGGQHIIKGQLHLVGFGMLRSVSCQWQKSHVVSNHVKGNLYLLLPSFFV